MIDGGLRKHFIKHLPTMHIQPVETGGVGCGVPDMNYCERGKEGWVEFKQCSANSIKFEPEQVGWTERRRRAGGRVFVAVRRQHEGGTRKGAPVDELWLFSGDDVRSLAMNGLNGPEPLLVSRGGPAMWQWPEVREFLLNFDFLFLPR